MRLSWICAMLSLLTIAMMKNSESVGIWWFATHMQMSAVGGSSSPVVLCNLIPGLPRRQRKLCQLHPDVMLAVLDGAKKAVAECQNQFSSHRWNCTTMEKGRILLKQGSREAAFVYAIYSAGIVFSVAKSCARGEITDCSCDSMTRKIMKMHGKDGKGAFTWGGCSDNVRYASKFGRQFIDSADKKSRDARALMNLHNIKVGRKIIKRSLQTQCKCHGVSGSCATRTCWKSLPKFNLVGDLLRAKHQKALQVTLNPTKVGSLLVEQASRLYDSSFSSKYRLPTVKNRQIPTDDDLVFFDLSPDYCANDMKSGSIGTYGRVCNRSSATSDSCDVMCCGRGYDTKQERKSHKCNCKFIWCCKVECQTCVSMVETYTCKPYNETFYYQHTPSQQMSLTSSLYSVNGKKSRKKIKKIGKDPVGYKNQENLEKFYRGKL